MSDQKIVDPHAEVDPNSQTSRHYRMAQTRLYDRWSKMGSRQALADHMLNEMARSAREAEDEVRALTFALEAIDKAVDEVMDEMGEVCLRDKIRDQERERRGRDSLIRLLKSSKWRLEQKLDDIREWPSNVKGITDESVFIADGVGHE